MSERAPLAGFHTITLGCKLNQFDSAAIEGELARRGLPHEVDPARAAVVVVNTCTVTGKADAEARKRIRGLRRANPGCRLLVTGCYAELDPRTLAAIEGVDVVFGNRDKPHLGRILDELGIGDRDEGPRAEPAGTIDRGCDGALELPAALHFADRSRAFLKVQEGCRLACSYCIIPAVRGTSRSVPPAEVERAALALWESGYREIVLTGVNTGDYGRDLEPATDLARLLRRLLDLGVPARIRLNSLEPLTVTDEIIDLMAAEPRLAPHLQIPLQSGSPAILRRMRRNYRIETYLERLEKVRAAVPDAGLGADVIVGFPGETEAMFEETRAFIAGSPLNYLHVFSWSPRPATPAAMLPGRVHGSAARERSDCLRALGAELGYRFRVGFVGRSLDVVVLGDRDAEGRGRALSGNFIEMSVEDPPPARELYRARVESVTAVGTRGRIDGVPAWLGVGAPGPAPDSIIG